MEAVAPGKISRWLRKSAVAGMASTALVTVVCSVPGSAAPMDNSAFGDVPLNQISVTGLHNAYDPAKGASILDGLDKGAHVLEIDVYTTYGGEHGWIVGHSDPFVNDNNCQHEDGPGSSTGKGSSTGSGGAETTQENGDLTACLDDLSRWSDSHPGHDPIYLKFEMKWGFRSDAAMGPADMDRLIAEHLGRRKVFTPADLLGAKYQNLDQAAKAGAWPTWNQLRGKFLLYPITGTVENVLASDHLDNLSTEQEYAEYVAGLAASGRIGQAMMFPNLSPGGAGGDPRTKYDAGLQPWFVLFDAGADYWLNNRDLSWYCANHYITVATGAESVAPALDDTDPDPAAAAQRVQYLAQTGHSSVSTFDWMNTPGAFTVQSRSC
ncbi:Ca2+-dependent phosphoinositide-specific phospholipase C [Nocardia stercoris]|uniref:Ca2+-dependent phosphoinositide-specific phospholipase C n=1 Tax=Nocardia stercoris TaxID=2483361 RepID=UPI00131A1711|nr:Ca2+-dependent phosphoinositide-specific phospholipase C [Nocardia stercoris]